VATSGPIPTPGAAPAGFRSTFVQLPGGGWELRNAGAPEELSKAGNLDRLVATSGPIPFLKLEYIGDFGWEDMHYRVTDERNDTIEFICADFDCSLTERREFNYI
jgi:hypothetical protein